MWLRGENLFISLGYLTTQCSSAEWSVHLFLIVNILVRVMGEEKIISLVHIQQELCLPLWLFHYMKFFMFNGVLTKLFYRFHLCAINKILSK